MDWLEEHIKKRLQKELGALTDREVMVMQLTLKYVDGED